MHEKLKWSFGICTSPGSEANLGAVISSIQSEFSQQEDYEILIVGNFDKKNITRQFQISDWKKIRTIPFNEKIFHVTWKKFRKGIKKFDFKSALYRPGWITRKKNILAKESQYENLCIMHDYVSLSPGWLAGFNQFKTEWKVCSNIIQNKNGMRHLDWCVNDFMGLEPALLPYEVNWLTKHMYISGAYFCVKKDFMLANPLNEKLFWNEGEDDEWSKRVRNKTEFKFNPNSKVIYTKLKDLDAAPYSADWVLREKIVIALLYARLRVGETQHPQEDLASKEKMLIDLFRKKDV